MAAIRCCDRVLSTRSGHSNRGRAAGEWASRAASCGQGWIVCPIRFSHSLDPQLTQRGMGLDRLAKRMNLESMATGPNRLGVPPALPGWQQKFDVYWSSSIRIRLCAHAHAS
jgi:hypothetical protein